jgi:hypothetical protein
MQRNRPADDAPGGRDRQQPQTAVERLMALIAARWGSEGADSKGRPCGLNLRCPLCLKPKMRIGIGDKPDALVAFCDGCRAKGLRLVKAIWEVTEISLSPMKPREPLPPQRRDEIIAKMRRSPEYEALPDRAKALVDLLVKALHGGEDNGDISRTGVELMQALKTRSKRQVGEAVSAAIASGIVFKRRLANVRGYGFGSSNRWGLKCLVEAINRRKK